MAASQVELNRRYLARKKLGLVTPRAAPAAPAVPVDPVLTALIAEVNTPRLDGAACVGRASLFDEAQPNEDGAAAAQRQLQALALCRGCPVLDACREWVASLPPRQRPPGVVAGRVT